MLPFLASVIRPPLIPPLGNNLLEQTQAFIRLVCQHKQQQLLLHHQQQQQQQFSFHHFKRELEERDEPHPPAKRLFSSTSQGQRGTRDLPETQRCSSRTQSPCSEWTVEQVCDFVASVELCKPYVEVSLTERQKDRKIERQKNRATKRHKIP